MFVCRLFHQDRPFEQIDTYFLERGSISIGRDPAADWTLSDTETTLSRIHCTLALVDGQLILTDCSTNGTFLGTGTRIAPETPTPVVAHDMIRLGALTILIDDPADAAASSLQSVASGPQRSGSCPDVDRDGASPARPMRNGALLEAFCVGAGIEASTVSTKDPIELMQELGSIYHELIFGLETLMAERTRHKDHHQLDRTTIGALDNNPFKWAPASRLAQDLLCTRSDGFLSGGAAVRASLDDLRHHIAALSISANASLEAVFAKLDPDSIEGAASSQGFSLRSRASTCWEDYKARYSHLRENAGSVSPLLQQAYQKAIAGDKA